MIYSFDICIYCLRTASEDENTNPIVFSYIVIFIFLINLRIVTYGKYFTNYKLN